MISVVFFGSFQNYSVQFLEKLHQNSNIKIVAVITTPPRPANHGVITKTAVHTYCESENIPIFPLEDLNNIPNIDKPDFIVVAGFGQLINDRWLNYCKYMAINFHPSLLPAYAGRFPIEWAILNSETTIGLSLIKMSPQFDKGDILAQKSLQLLPTDTKESLYFHLYQIGAQTFIESIPSLISSKITPTPQTGSGFYARQITKNDGFIDNLDNIKNKLRALNPWPGVWTYVYDKTGHQLKMKIISVTQNNQKTEFENVLIEGKKPTLWSQISSHYSLTK
ncbi:MAG: methionyl-tRNA formyltransferase [Microgenomates group bacterium]